jgi:hypothetical protein
VKEELMSRPDEGMIHTWLDGECSADEAAYVERMVATDPEWASAVAEARGLIAASSRIVSALDAVPARVVPSGTKAAPGTEKIAPASPEQPASDGFRLRPWMKMAAGVVLVAGTAFAIRETTREVFQSPPATVVRDSGVATVPVAAPAAAPDVAPVVAAAPTPPVARERSVAKAAPVAEASQANDAEAPPAVLPAAPPAAPQASVSPAPTPAERFAAMQRRMENNPLSQVVTTGTRGAEPERILDSPNSISMVSSERLVECWQVTSPDSLRTLLQSSNFLPGKNDSLRVEIPKGSQRFVSVLRKGDTLRGGFTAELVRCPTP